MSSSATLAPVPMLDFSREYSVLRDDILRAITAVCDSQKFILGPAVESFEREAAVLLRVHSALGCASGTDALWLALAALKIGPGDKVLTTPFSFFATASSILRAGAQPVFADIDPATFNLPADTTADALRRDPSIRAVLPVHLYGQCAEISPEIAARIPVVEDAAQAIGASWNGTRAGGLGSIAAFSFYPTKNLAAFGEAGLVTTNDPALAERVTMLRAHGMRRRYFHDEVGWNARMDGIQGAVLAVRLQHLEAGNARRRALAALYDRLFTAAGLVAEGGITLPHTDPRAEHVFHQYVIRAPRRDDLRAHLTALGIGSEVYYPLPLHLQPALASLGYGRGDFPHAERAAEEVLALPIYPYLRDDEAQTVVEAIRRFYA